MKTREIGNIGEDMAVKFLLDLNYEILERNFTKNHGEIDIIAKDKNFIVFVEVKSRKNINFGYPRDFVNNKKIRKLQETAQMYLIEKNLINSPIRFDVVEIIFNEEKIEHIINAF